MGWVAGGFLLVAGVAAFAWITGQTRTGFLHIHTSIEINANKDAVWAVLADFAAYREWNPLMIEVRAESKPGERMDWSSRLKGTVREYNAQIDRALEGRELTWTGPVSGLLRIVFWGQHRFTIEDIDGGRVRLTNAEWFGGLLTPFIASFLKNDVREAYDEANAALKRRVESRQIGNNR